MEESSAKIKEDYLILLNKLCSVPGISGRENETGISGVILEELKSLGPREISEDEFGNVVAVFGVGNKRILLEAHIDEVGFEVSGFGRKGEIILAPIGLMNFTKISGSRAYLISKNIKGKIMAKAGGITFDLDNKNEKNDIAPGDVISFERYFQVDGDIAKAIALDNRVGCAAIIELVKNIGSLEGLSVVAVFSTGEESDCSTVGKVAARYKPDFGIVIDAAYAKPIDMDPERTSIPEIGCGCAIQRLGENFVVDPEVVGRFEKIAETNNIKCQSEIPLPDLGRTNVPQLDRASIKTGVINIPVRYQHTSNSEFSVNDAAAAIKLILAFIKQF